MESSSQLETRLLGISRFTSKTRRSLMKIFVREQRRRNESLSGKLVGVWSRNEQRGQRREDQRI
jgi:hypothetical protein